ncbi:MAG: hypothetical protein ABI643_03730 [Candidatus Doudnabacteria bacterium]
MNFKFSKIIVLFQLLLSLFLFTGFAAAQGLTGTVNSGLESAGTKVAPGEFLPVSIKLVNFGSNNRLDVTINYEIFDSRNDQVFSASETVAVETTSSYVKRIQLPSTLKPGLYSFHTSLLYPGQVAPAVSTFPFTVENKIGGIFQSDLIFYAIIFGIIVLIVVGFVYWYTAWRTTGRMIIFDYSNKPKDQRIYYEILSDIIAEIKQHRGDDALEVAKDIPDLEINPTDGQVLNIKKNPAQIIALLISRYEKLYGQKISFGLRQK